jgi:Na+/proline symporter
VNALDYVVLFGTLLGIAAYGMWRTRGRKDLRDYLSGGGQSRWFLIGLSVMATQASAVTFLSTPGQGYQDGLGFVQNYFGTPFALIIIAIFFLPIYRRLNVYTAYEYLGQRFDAKTRLLGAALFLVQRGLGAGLTIYAPAIVLSTIFGWPLGITIICSGLVVIAYTVAGGSDAVSLTQKYQLGIIFAGMMLAFVLLVMKLPSGLSLGGAMTLAGGFHKLQAVDFSTNLHERYTFWSGLFGGTFLMLSYFGTDQSQVQRYIRGASLRESRLGLMFNAVWKIPMQFFILLIGVLIFVFYQFEQPPVFFNRAVWKNRPAGSAQAAEAEFATAHAEERRQLDAWLLAHQAGDETRAKAALALAVSANKRVEGIRDSVKALLGKEPGVPANDNDYIFITFILDYLPHGVIGLLTAAFFAAALNSKAAELNSLASSSVVDFYRHLLKRQASDRHYVRVAKCFTAFWGLFAIAVAIFANLSENLVQAANILGSLFYGVPLGIFLLAFFVRPVGGTAVFWSAVAGEVLILILYSVRHVIPALDISYLWYNLIGCAACMLFSLVLQAVIGFPHPTPAASATS